MSETQVFIAGAGPTGLMLAVWLARLGVRVRVADPKGGPVQETRAIALQARTLEFYDQLVLGDQVTAHGRPFSAINLYTRGRWRARVRLTGLGGTLTPHPYLFVFTQDQNERLLCAELERLGGRVDWHTRVSGVAQDADGVSVTLQSEGQPEGGPAETVRAAYVAACDGASSTVRHTLGVPMSGGTYAQRFYVADVTLSGQLIDGEVNVTFDQPGHGAEFLASFPIPEPGRFRIVGGVPKGAGEDVTFDDIRPALEGGGLAQVERLHWFSTYRVHHRVADRFRVGRAFVLGDAGHVHTPVGGQGMNTGLGDAVNLAWKLAAALRHHDDALLDTYEAERRPFALGLVNTTDRVFTGAVDASPLTERLRLDVLPRLLPLLTRPEWVRRALFRTVSQLEIHYPHSVLSAGKAGRVRGGLRLPWVRLEGGASNFDALRSLDWQVHVYGTPGPEVLAWCARHAVPLHTFPYGPAARRAGLAQDAVYLVRPDGYVGLAQPVLDAAEADGYAARCLVGGGQSPSARA